MARPDISSEDIHFDTYDSIEPGNYLAQCVEALLKFNPRFGRWTVFLSWDIYDGAGEKIGKAKRWLPIGVRDSKLHVGRGTLFYNWWISANGGRLPTRRDRMNPKIFRSRWARVLVVASEPPPRRKGKSLSEYPPYSKVGEILSWVNGQ